MALDYDTGKKIFLKTIIILGVITIVEVLIALTGKGYIIEGLHFPVWLMGGVMIAMSAYKAYLIVYEFMHMKYEVPGMVKSVLLPMFLLVWAIVAFLMEGNYWNNSRSGIAEKNKEVRSIDGQSTGMLYEIKESDFQ